MGKFLLGAVVGVLVTILGVIVIGLVAGKIFSTKQPSVPANAVLVLSIQDAIPEAETVDISLPFFERGGASTVRDLWTSLHRAAKDNRVKALVVQPRSLAIGSAKLQEIHEQILDFKRSGKPVYAFLQDPGSREYYLASAADKIYLSPDDMLNVKGYRAELTYFKSVLDKVGVNFQVDHIGAYKDAGDTFTRTNMTPQTREVLNAVLDQLFNDFCTTVGQGRHKSNDEMKALVDQGPFTATQAKNAGLIDQVGYEDQVYADLKAKTGAGELNRITVKKYSKGFPTSGDRIAVLVGEGEISHGDSGDAVDNTANISYAGMRKLIRQVRDDSSIKGVILRVDSPGGDAVASDQILHELKLLAAVKPLVISFSDLAASGGYYISMTGDTIVSYPNTITGSIGVLYARPNVQNLLGKLGVTVDSVSRGRLADLDSLTQPLSDAAQQKLHEQILETYNTFVSKVAIARRKSFDQVEPLAQGHVWMGAQARQNGLIDELGGFDKSVSIIRKKAHLSDAGETNLVVFPPTRSLWEVLANSSSDSLEEAVVNTRMRKLIPGLPSNLLLHGGLLKLLPYQITVQ